MCAYQFGSHILCLLPNATDKMCYRIQVEEIWTVVEKCNIKEDKLDQDSQDKAGLEGMEWDQGPPKQEITNKSSKVETL